MHFLSQPDFSKVTNMAEYPSFSSRPLNSSQQRASCKFATSTGTSSLPVPNAATTTVTSIVSQMPDAAFLDTANNLAAQMQSHQLLMSMGHRMGHPMHMNMGMDIETQTPNAHGYGCLPFAADFEMQPSLIPFMMPSYTYPIMEPAFHQPMMPKSAVGFNFCDAQQKLLQQKPFQYKKRYKTKISDAQLEILRAFFGINNSPTEDQFVEISKKSWLPIKAIKQWFRYNIFNERQRNKYSPYHFNNPSLTHLNLEEYEKTGEANVIPVSVEEALNPETSYNVDVQKKDLMNKENEKCIALSEIRMSDNKKEKFSNSGCLNTNENIQNQSEPNIQFNSMNSEASDIPLSKHLSSDAESLAPTSSSIINLDLRISLDKSSPSNLNAFDTSSSIMPLMPPTHASSPKSESPHSMVSPLVKPTPSDSRKRVNLTKFTRNQYIEQKKVLQANEYLNENDVEFLFDFLKNAYSNDDDLEYLSPTPSSIVNLDPRTSLDKSSACNLNAFDTASSIMPPTSASPPTSESPHSTVSPLVKSTPSDSRKRVNLRKFTGKQYIEQEKIFQANEYLNENKVEFSGEFFKNAYHNDDDLECLSPSSSSLINLDARTSLDKSSPCYSNAFDTASSIMPITPPTSASPTSSESSHSMVSLLPKPTPSYSRKRVYTKFTGNQYIEQKKVFQANEHLNENDVEFLSEFLKNAYPNDDDLEYLSKLLSLSTKVISNWFENARLTARKERKNKPVTAD